MIMTDEEKKEFEEFLQWKAERAKKQEAEKQSVEDGIENTPVESSKEQAENAENKSNISDPQKEYKGDTAIIVFLVIVAFIILGVIVFGFSHKNPQPVLSDVEDSVAAAVIDDDFVVDPVVDAKQDSIAKAERISAIKKTIKITSAYLGRPNSASGVDAYFYYKNLSDKTIKYLIWEGYPMNAVGDRVSCEIRGYGDYRGKDTGPVKPGKSSGGCWGCAWYNSTAKKLILTGIEIEYLDGSTFTIKENEIEYVR